MAKEFITGLAIKKEVIEWTTLHYLKDRQDKYGFGEIQLHSPEEPSTEEPEKAEEETPEQDTDTAITEDDSLENKTKHEITSLKGDLVMGLPSENILLRVISLPKVDPEEMKSMVALQVDKFSPFPIENMVTSYEILESTEPDAEEETCLVLVAAVQEETVSSTGKPILDSGIYPAQVGATILAWWQLLADTQNIIGKGIQVILMMNTTVPEIIVFQNGRPIIFRALSDRGTLSDEEFIAEIEEEIDYTLMSIELEHGSTETYTISIWHDENIPVALKAKLESDSSRKATINSVDSIPPISEGLARRALNTEAGIDLSPLAWKSAKKSKVLKKKVLISSSILLGVWLICVLGFVGGLQHQKSKVSSLRDQNTKWGALATEVREMKERIKTISRYMDKKYSALECLREISSLLPKGIDLSSFTYRKGDQLKIGGKADHVNIVYDLRNKLDSSELFATTSLTGPTLDARTRKQKFTIDLTFPTGEQE